MKTRVKMTDTVPSLLKGVKARLPSRAAMGSLASKGRTVIQGRTLQGQSETGASFGTYKTAPYYAPIENRPPGYPTPSGGTPTKSGKSMKYASYADYKGAMGFGTTPQLSVSNQMLSDIVWNVQSQTRAYIFFASRLSAAKAHGHDSGDYPFFGLGDNLSEQEMNDELLKQFRKARSDALAQVKAKRTQSK